MNKVVWIVGMMCTGKTTLSHKLEKMFGVKFFHLDHINQSLLLVEAYREAIEGGYIEGFTPLRDGGHYEAIMKALEGKEVEYILVAPPYEQWKKNCIPIIECPTDENPPDYSEEEYEFENERIKNLTKPNIITC